MKPTNSKRSCQTRPTIGLLIHSVARIGQAIWLGASDAAQEHDVNLVCVEGGVLRGPTQQWNILYELIPPNMLDGIILWTSAGFRDVSHEEFTRFWQRYAPCPRVSIGAVEDDFSSILLNTRLGISAVVTHLIQCHGYRRIAYIYGQHAQSPIRYQGYVDALTEHGIPVDPALVVGHTLRLGAEEDGAAAIAELLDERRLSVPEDVEAIVACSDLLAIGAMKALQTRGFRVPGDVAVTGFDNNPRASIATPPLTTVHQPFYETGWQAVELILAGLHGEEMPPERDIPTTLYVRQSCGCVSSSVKMAAAQKMPAISSPQDAPLPSFRTDDVIAEMERTSALSGQASILCMTRLMKRFLAEIRGESPGAFLETLHQVAEAAVTPARCSDLDGVTLHTIISTLRLHLLPYLEDYPDARHHAENLWQQARVSIAEAQEHARARNAFEEQQQAEAIQGLGQTLITTFDVNALMEKLIMRLPSLGIHSGALALYEDPQPYAYPNPAPEWSRMLLAYDEAGQHDATPEDRRVLSRRLLPDHLVPQHRRYTMMVEALHFLDQQIGVIALEMGPRTGTVYGMLRGQISSALQGALLVQHVRERSAEIVRQKYILDTFMANVPDSIYFKDQESRFIRANLALANLLGAGEPVDLIGKTDFDFFLEEEARPKYEQEQTIIRTGQPVLAQEEPHGDGGWALTTKMPLRDEHGDIIGTFGISRDITDLKRAQQEIELHANELAAAYEEINILNRQLESENLRMGAELDVARQIQTMILPKPDELRQIEGIDIVGYMQPADEIGGDYYDVLNERGIVHVGIGDVTGHGLESGIIMLMTQTAIRTLIEHGETDPVKFVATLNRTIYKNVRRMRADKTMSFALINYANGQLKLVGQHEELLVIRKGGVVEQVDTVNLGFPIGLEEDIAEWVATATISLKPGDGIVLYTDGITEAANANEKLYGLERLCEIISRNWAHSAESIKQAVIDDVTRYIDTQKIYDDITLVVLKQQ